MKQLENALISQENEFARLRRKLNENLIFGFQSIIVNENEKEKILEWLNNGKREIIYLKLVYRRGDNYNLKNFHQKCDNIGPNLVLCESLNNEVFGGYTPFSWEGKGRNVHNNSAFIFSLTKNKKYPCKYQYKSNWIDESSGPDFHWDFVFNCNNSMKFCRSLILKDIEKHNINVGYNCYLDDEPLFENSDLCEVKEVEVFQVLKYNLVPFDK